MACGGQDGGRGLTLHSLQQLLVLAGLLRAELQTLGGDVEDSAVLLLRHLVCFNPTREEEEDTRALSDITSRTFRSWFPAASSDL